MISKFLIAWFLLALTVTIHSVGVSALLGHVVSYAALPGRRFWHVTFLFVRVGWWLVLLHLAQIAIWGLFYWWQKCLPDLESSFYFSAVTYSTVGYGDLVLPPEWRMVGAVEGLTGILMCGLSTGFFFALASRVYGARAKANQT